MTAVAIFTCQFYVYMPWWAVLLAVLLSAVLSLPVDLIQALTNQQPGLNIIAEYVIGYILPGAPIANVTFKTLGYISMVQTLTFTSDLKLGHYMKVPPKAMFIAQLMGTVIARTVNLSTAYWLLNTQPKVCDGNKDFACSQARTFYSASVIWVIQILVVSAATGMMSPAYPYHYANWLTLGFAFNFFARRYHSEWHLRFTYVLSAVFDSGVAFFGLLYFLIFTTNNIKMPQWWGTTDICRLDGYPLMQPESGMPDPWAVDPDAEDVPMYNFSKPYVPFNP
ncbi:hypothetical protein BG015_004874 [Linnemannia schmuckeri]|uniref:Oligopeptide transporter n=1 Tax=Linnemannia schmuckeri TaxID=64567 RepID=A0A9P5UYK5_9FUNG|nr:hypothetical protein BG015_004874 [Linnemannia schmuckeri]